MAAVKVGASGSTLLATTGASAGMTGAYGQAPTAGNLLVMGVTMSAGIATVTSCTTPAGWTAGPTGNPSGTADYKGALYTFWRVAVGGDTGPAVTVAGGQYSTAIVVEEFSGITSPVVDTTRVTTKNTPYSLAADSLASTVTTSASGLVWCVLGAMVGLGPAVTAWTFLGKTQEAWGCDYVQTSAASAVTAGAGTYATGPSWPTSGTTYVYGASAGTLAFKAGAGGGPVTLTASGTTTAVATTSGNPTAVTTAQQLAASGTIAIVAACTGSPTRVLLVLPATGTAAVVSASTGDPTRASLTLAAAGTTPATSTTAGDPTVVGGPGAASGTVTATTTLTGNPTRVPLVLAASGTIPAAATTSGDATRTPLTLPASGTITAAATTTGDPTNRVPLVLAASGTVNVIATTLGDTTRQWRTFAASGTIGAVTFTTGAATITGTAPVQTNITVTATLDPRRWAATIDDRRWEAHL